MKLSVIIITKNEAVNIQACLKSVEFAGERIVVDSGSTDGTTDIARAAGATVIETTDWPGFGPQKQRALDAAKGEWVLSLDADERISDDLRDEILMAITQSQHDAYLLPRLSSFCGHFIRHGGWYPDYILRLFRRGSADFSKDMVHERVIPHHAASIKKLPFPIVHYSYRDDSDVLRKLEHYSSLGAKQAFAAGKRGGFGKVISHSAFAFIRTYIFKAGFLDGLPGLMVAIMAAEYTYHKYIKLMQLSSQEQQ